MDTYFFRLSAVSGEDNKDKYGDNNLDKEKVFGGKLEKGKTDGKVVKETGRREKLFSRCADDSLFGFSSGEFSRNLVFFQRECISPEEKSPFPRQRE